MPSRRYTQNNVPHYYDALKLLHDHVYQNTEELNMKRMDHAASLCPYLLISTDSNINKNTIEIVTLTKQLFNMEPKPKVPLEIYSLKADCIFSNLNCPFEDDNEFIKNVVSDADKEDKELTKDDLMSYIYKSVFRAFFLRAMLSRNECLDEEDGVDETWREELLDDSYYKKLFSLMLYEFVVINSLYERYAFWPHYEIIRDTKQRIENLIDDILSELSKNAKNMLLFHLSEAAAIHGYYWSFARSFLHFKINEKPKEQNNLTQSPEKQIEQEKLLQTPDKEQHNLMQTPEKQIEQDNLLQTPEKEQDNLIQTPEKQIEQDNLLQTPEKEQDNLIQTPEKQIEQDNSLQTPENQDNLRQSPEKQKEDNLMQKKKFFNAKKNEEKNVVKLSGINAVDKECIAECIDMSKLEDIVTGTGYFHSLQGQLKYSSTTSESTLCALMLRSISAAEGDAGVLRAELEGEGGAGALDAVINVYYNHNQLMLYERELITASWAQIVHNTCIARYLCACVTSRGWTLPAHAWDFTNVTLCSLVTSLRDSVTVWGCAKVAMLSQAVLELFIAVRKFVADVPARAQRQQPSAHVAALISEWDDIFAPDLNNNLFDIICHVLNDHNKPMTLSRTAVVDSLLRVTSHLQWERVTAARVTSLAHRVTDAALKTLGGVAHHVYLYLAYAVLEAVDKPLVLDDAEKLAAWGGSTSEEAPQLSLERLHGPLLQLHDLVDAALQDIEVCVCTCETVSGSDAARVALSALLSAAAVLRRTTLARSDLHHYYVQIAREYEYANYILPHALRLLPAEALHERALSPTLLAQFHTPPTLNVYEWCNHSTISAVACYVVNMTLGGVASAGARAYAATLEPRAAAALRRVARRAVTPALLKKQLSVLRDRAGELVDTQVSIQWSRAEVQLSLSVEEQTLSLCVQFSDDHPLSPPRVTTPHALSSHASPSHASSAQAQDTQWIVLYLAYQNGSLLNAAKMWVSALTSRVAAAPVCYICYCRLLPAAGATRARLPAVPCHTCRNSFHAHCLRKWFATSNKSNCPLCRSKF